MNNTNDAKVLPRWFMFLLPIAAIIIASCWIFMSNSLSMLDANVCMNIHHAIVKCNGNQPVYISNKTAIKLVLDIDNAIKSSKSVLSRTYFPGEETCVISLHYTDQRPQFDIRIWDNGYINDGKHTYDIPASSHTILYKNILNIVSP